MRLKELFEEVNIKLHPHLYITYNVELARYMRFQNFYKDEKELLEDLQNNLIKLLDSEVSLENISHNIDMKVNVDSQDIDELRKKANEYIFKKFNIPQENWVNKSNNEVRYSPDGKLLPHKLSYERMRLLFYDNKKNSLLNIHKNIACREVVLLGVNKVEDGGLGLLLVDDLKTLIFSTSGVDIPWCTIIKNHFKGDKDILDCQEELISAGHKEYAKL